MPTFAEQHPLLTQSVSPESLEGDLISPAHPAFGLIWINPARMSGAPCFFASRVPIQTLFDYLADGSTLEEFLEGYPPVTRDQATAVIELAASGMLASLPGKRR